MRVALVLILLSTTVYSQNIYQFAKRGKKVKVQRTVTVGLKYEALARRVLHQPLIKRVHGNTITLRATRTQPLTRPLNVVGTTNYLKGVGRAFKGRNGWERIGQSGSYNGAHHIVTKSVIKQISGKEGEIIANAPAVFHPLHNSPNFENMFHDHERQLQIYQESGIQGIIIDFFDRANAVSGRLGIPLYNDEVIHQALIEAELWAKHWNLKWE